MADNTSHRASRAPLGRGNAAPFGDGRHAASDPLAELARLIGQDDPFIRRGPEVARRAPSFEPPAPPAAERSAAPWLARTDAASPGWDEEEQSPTRYARRSAPVAATDSRRSPYPMDDLRRPAASRSNEPRETAPPDGRPELETSSEAPPVGGRHEAGAYYEDDGEIPAEHEEEIHEELPRERRRRLLPIAAVLGVAILGMAGAYGYWTWSGGSGSASEPPVIMADPTPSKVVPASQGDNASNKRIYDRVGEKGQSSGERVVSREEQPIDVGPPAAPPAVPGPLGGMPPPGAVVQAPPAAPVGVPSGTKSTRTIAIRPDQTATVDAAPPSGMVPAMPPMRSTTIGVPPSASRPGPAPIRAAKGAQPPASSPLALGPQSSPDVDPAATSALPPARPAPASGGYVVQVASLRSEEDAMTSFKILQHKYPDVLGSHPPVVQRVDLSDKGKGIWYRAQVGPFASKEEAAQMCDKYKAAGGQCQVQKN